jgi:hypothetical protein
MRLLSTASFIVANLACASVPPQPSAEIIGVADVMNAKSTYAGRRIAVEGRVRVQTLSGLHACEAGQSCPKYDDALLTLVNPRASKLAGEELLRIYRRGANGKAEPVHCRIVDENLPAFDCGTYMPDAVVVVEGTFTKEPVPDQTVVDAGRVRVLSYRDVFYLVID